ncbi:MAG: hypothetical protein JRG69_13745, partial [Deltaproteobacteria bacterium]|nr:hypothetical protein [Deltaproteobacteria bacterium]
NDNRIYIRKTQGEQIEHFAAIDYWTLEYYDHVDVIYSPFLLDKECFKDYAEKLIPRAVGYSAGLLDYFFRGSIEILALEGFLYSIIDGSISPQQFTYIKANLRNVTPKEKNEQGDIISYEQMGPGTLIAVAKYKKRTDYQPDLSTDPPTAGSRDEFFSLFKSTDTGRHYRPLSASHIQGNTWQRAKYRHSCRHERHKRAHAHLLMELNRHGLSIRGIIHSRRDKGRSGFVRLVTYRL